MNFKKNHVFVLFSRISASKTNRRALFPDDFREDAMDILVYIYTKHTPFSPRYGIAPFLTWLSKKMTLLLWAEWLELCEDASMTKFWTPIIVSFLLSVFCMRSHPVWVRIVGRPILYLPNYCQNQAFSLQFHAGVPSCWRLWFRVQISLYNLVIP